MRRERTVMNKTTIRTALVALVALGTFAPAAGAADAARGKEKADQICAACHGKDGATPIDPSYPKLAGQHADYLVKALEDYHSGARKNPMMAPMAQNLTAQDRLDLAAWFSSQPQGLSVVK